MGIAGVHVLGAHFCAHFPRWSTTTKTGNSSARTLPGAVGCVGLFCFGGQFGLPLCLALRGLCLCLLIALKCIVGLACHHSSDSSARQRLRRPGLTFVLTHFRPWSPAANIGNFGADIPPILPRATVPYIYRSIGDSHKKFKTIYISTASARIGP